jgi:hypothetical protein
LETWKTYAGGLEYQLRIIKTVTETTVGDRHDHTHRIASRVSANSRVSNPDGSLCGTTCAATRSDALGSITPAPHNLVAANTFGDQAMTINGGKPHAIGDRGQRYEVTFFNPATFTRQVLGWSSTMEGAESMASGIDKHPVWEQPQIVDRGPCALKEHPHG